MTVLNWESGVNQNSRLPLVLYMRVCIHAYMPLGLSHKLKESAHRLVTQT